MPTIYKTLGFMGFPNYRVGNDGEVQSYHPHSRIHNGWKILKGHPIKRKGQQAYTRVQLANSEGESPRVLVHRLVLLAFVGPCPEGMVACHKDDNGLNNKLDNLRWGTPASNWEDAVRNGGAKYHFGETACAAVFTNEQVRWMRKEMAAMLSSNPKLSVRSIARAFASRFKKSVNTIRGILKGYNWKTIQ